MQRVRSVVAACDLELDVPQEIGIVGIGARAREQRQLKTRLTVVRRRDRATGESINGQTVNKKKSQIENPRQPMSVGSVGRCSQRCRSGGMMGGDGGKREQSTPRGKLEVCDGFWLGRAPAVVWV